jgi:outer membrane protein assembly factor BamE (lipoprotein component of BamABCDE complex)
MIHDGPFEQVSGKLLDQATIDALKEKKALLEEVILTLGTPQDRAGTGAAAEVLFYTSVRSRTAYESVFGIKYSQSTQTMIDKWRLSFAGGRLSAVSHQSEIK